MEHGRDEASRPQAGRAQSRRSIKRPESSPIFSTPRSCDICPCLPQPNSAIIAEAEARAGTCAGPIWELIPKLQPRSSLTSRFCPQVIVPHGSFKQFRAKTMIPIDQGEGGYTPSRKLSHSGNSLAKFISRENPQRPGRTRRFMSREIPACPSHAAC